jgi:hypothetical protein
MSDATPPGPQTSAYNVCTATVSDTVALQHFIVGRLSKTRGVANHTVIRTSMCRIDFGPLNCPRVVFRYDADHAFVNEQRMSVHDHEAAEQVWCRPTDFFKK